MRPQGILQIPGQRRNLFLERLSALSNAGCFGRASCASLYGPSSVAFASSSSTSSLSDTGEALSRYAWRSWRLDLEEESGVLSLGRSRFREPLAVNGGAMLIVE
jgi:hypothetical protein